MENWGLVTFSENIMKFNNNNDFHQKAFVDKVTQHEAAHMWFGNLVTMKEWNDLWLNEAFATFMPLMACKQLNTDKKFDLYTFWLMT